MKTNFKKNLPLLAISLMLVLSVFILIYYYNKDKTKEKATIKVGICAYDRNDIFVSHILSDLEKQIKELPSGTKTLRPHISDSKNNQSIQNDLVEKYIDLDYDLICINIVDRTDAAFLIDKATAANIPLIFFNREPVKEDIFRSDNVYYVGSDPKESAEIQAKLIYNAIEKQNMDKNNNGVLEYMMIEGEQGHQDTVIRTEYSIKVLEQLGAKTKKIGGYSANYEKSQSTILMKQWIEDNPDEINQVELIISNNDDMALGVLEALESLDIKGISIVGIDGIPAVKDAINKGEILGTVESSKEVYAKALLELILDLSKGKQPMSQELEEGRYIWIPWEPYISTK